MNETKIRINEYKRMLPKLRERVIAVALLLAISASMLTTVTFAWITLSTNPEVTSVSTSIAANGNLEIALASGDSSPWESRVGDGVLPDLERNKTWGNLINLSSSEYGLDNIVLRPALLNKSNLIERPLYGPVYDDYGRVYDTETNFGYAKWDSFMSRFTSTTDELFENDPFGVRAITSMKYGGADDNADVVKYNRDLDTITEKNIKVKDAFRAIANVSEHQAALQSLMTGYMVENQLKNDPSVGDMVSDANLLRADLENCVNMYEALIQCFEDEAVVVADLLNLQSIVRDQAAVNAGMTGTAPRTTSSEILGLSYSTDDYENSAKKALAEKGFIVAEKGLIANLDQFLADYHTIISDLERLKSLITWFGNSNSKKWKSTPVVDENAEEKVLVIDDIVHNLVDVGKCTIVDESNNKVRTIGNITAGDGVALNGAQCMTNINNGILYNFHSFCGGVVETDGYLKLQVSVSLVSATIESKVRTVASEDYYNNESSAVKKIILDEFGEPPYLAVDTYGFAIDFWVRTNAAGTFLTLQGNVLTETRQEYVTGKDTNGNEVDIYTITVQYQSGASGEESSEESNATGDLGIGLTQSFDVYKVETKDDSGNVTETFWYFADNHSLVTTERLGLEEGATIPTPIRKIETVEYVIGYEGDNRIWNGDEHVSLSVNSSTQGSGSCYVFYAESPIDQERSLEILKSMKVAFINEEGDLLATAFMDSDHHYAESGKVIVPLVLDNESISIGTDINGDPMYAITALEQNVATRITAIVYLDGTYLNNDHVLASADIEGKINIQFGSSAALYPLGNEELYNAELVASVNEISPTSFDYETLRDGEKMITTVKVAVMGDQPGTMTANFIRRINATQGSPEGTFTLTDEDGDGVWEGTYEFLYPGEYILRSVYMDGVERDLQLSTPGQFPTVTVTGHTIASVSTLDKTYVMTDANTYSDDITITFASNNPDTMPRSVVGKFSRVGGGVVNVNFVYDPTSASWKGNANFVSSGVYKMQFLLLDGQYAELPEVFWREIELILGMRVNVTTISSTEFGIEDENIPSSLQMRVEIVDNNGDIIPGLIDAALTYKMDGGYDNMYTALTWDHVNQYYEGEFYPEMGVWKFNYVTVRIGDAQNAITRVNSDAPVFTIVPPDPPAYVDYSGVEHQFITGNTPADVQVAMSDASSATLYAKFTKLDANGVVEKTVFVPHSSRSSSEGGEYWFYFDITETGIWRLDALSAFYVYDENKNYYSMPEGGVVDEASFNTGYIFDARTTSDEDVVFEPRTVYVLHSNDVDVSVAYADDLFPYTTEVNNEKTGHFGKDSNGNVTADFMASHTIGANKVTLTFSDDYNLIGSGRFTVSDVSFGYNDFVGGEEYGGFTTASLALKDKYGQNTFSFEKQADGSFVNNNQLNFQYAARYTASDVNYTISGIDEKQKASLSGAYSIEVYSKTPELKWTAVSPDSVTYLKNTTALHDDGSNVGDDAPMHVDPTELLPIDNTISEDGYTANVFFNFGIKKETGGCNSQTDKYVVVYDDVKPSSATATLYNVTNGNFSCSITYTGQTISVSNFGNAQDYTATVTYTFGKNKMSDTQDVGRKQMHYGDGLAGGLGALAGVEGVVRVVLGPNPVSVETITITYDGIDFTVKLDNPLILINKY